MIVLVALVACTPSEGPGGRGHHPQPKEETGALVVETGGHTGDTAGGETGDTATEPPVDCSTLLTPEAMAASWTYTSSIVTEEDFDFDDQGYLIMQRNSDLQGIDRNGQSHPIAPNTGDPTGIRATSLGYVTIAHPGLGIVELVDPATGGSLTLLAGLTNPNGIEAGEDGMMYVTENTTNGRVRMVDSTNGDFEVIAELPFPNGLVLSPDEQVLYVASSDSAFGSQTHIVAIERDASGDWDPSTKHIVYTHPAYVGSVTMDACGNLYGLEYSQGRVFRLNTATLVVEPIVDFGTFGSWSALHFSPGLGGFDLNTLYVTSRQKLYLVPTGVPGSHVLTP